MLTTKVENEKENLVAAEEMSLYAEMSMASTVTPANEADNEPPIGAAPKMRDIAYYGILKNFIEVAAINSEASPVAVAANVISFFCATLGWDVHQNIGDSVIHCRPFFLLVGKSGKARKGTAEALPRRVFKRVDEIRSIENPSHSSLNIHGGGLSSGEGIAHAIRDELGSPDDKNYDPGVLDKRLLVIEPEFAGVLANCKRETSTLSAVIRNVYDGRTLHPLTKTNKTCATNPHVLITGHITRDELINKVINGVETTNGLLNRFLICFVAREQLVALPAATDKEVIESLAEKLIDIFKFIAKNQLVNLKSIEIVMSREAEIFWTKVYPDLTKDGAGITGSLQARSEVYSRMLAMVFALFDKKLIIEIPHLEASLCWIDYVHQSVWHLFGSADEKNKAEGLDKFAEEIYVLLKTQGQMSRSEISNKFGWRKKDEVKNGLERLINQAPARIEQYKEKTTGRSKEMYRVK